MDNHNFGAGAFKVDITPPLGTLINGNFVAFYARKIHDPLYAKSLVLQNEQVIIAFVVVDICVMRKDFINDIKETIYVETGIKPDHILICSTHTHAAGSVESILLGAADLPYRQHLKTLIIASVKQALQHVRPAKIAYGKVDVPEHVLIRRYRMKPGYRAYNPVTGGLDKVKTNPFGDEDQIEAPNSVPDPEVGYLAVQDLDDQWIGLLANYSMHYVGDWEDGTITADYFGVFADQMKTKLRAADDFVAMMTNGTSGDANINEFLHPERYPRAFFEKSKLIGSDIVHKVIGSMKELDWERDPALGAVVDNLDMPLRKPSEREVKEAVAIVKSIRYEQLSTKEISHTGNDEILKAIYAREQVLLDGYPDKISFPVQVIRVGSGIIGGLGGEFFSETGLWLKANVEVKNYFTITQANDSEGYIPPAHEFDLGGYETWRRRGCFLHTRAEEEIKNRLLQLTKQLE